jgi:GST-like protein
MMLERSLHPDGTMENSGSYTVFSVLGWGSALVEAMLALCSAPVHIEDVTGFDRAGAARDRLLRVNALGQIPTLLLPEGTVMTESAAIALLLSERHPQAGLAPAPGTPFRPTFLRRLIWIAANVYPTFTYGDYPERWVSAGTASLKAATNAYRERLWRQFEADTSEGAWVLGAQLSALDVYVAVMTHWRPGRAWFAAQCPRLHAIATRADQLPPLKVVLERNFPSAA